MKKKYSVVDIDCANCAAKIEDGIKKIDGVNEASLNFMSEKLTIDVDESKLDIVIEEIKKVIKKIEPDATMK